MWLMPSHSEAQDSALVSTVVRFIAQAPVSIFTGLGWINNNTTNKENARRFVDCSYGGESIKKKKKRGQASKPQPLAV